MNRIVTMVLKNLWYVPGAWFKLCNYAKHTDRYPEVEKWRHIQYILRLAVKGGNIDLQVTGLENIPGDEPFMMYANHQGMFDVLAIAATCDAPLGAVLKKELYDVPFLLGGLGEFLPLCTISQHVGNYAHVNGALQRVAAAEEMTVSPAARPTGARM